VQAPRDRRADAARAARYEDRSILHAIVGRDEKNESEV
jgi:hypothetical protein